MLEVPRGPDAAISDAGGAGCSLDDSTKETAIMNTHNNTTDAAPTAAIDCWENEGGASAKTSMDDVYGRRVEADQTWTVYHVFTGVPASEGAGAMTGLSQVNATDRMLALNLNNLARRRERARPKRRALAKSFELRGR